MNGFYHLLFFPIISKATYNSEKKEKEKKKRRTFQKKFLDFPYLGTNNLFTRKNIGSDIG